MTKFVATRSAGALPQPVQKPGAGFTAAEDAEPGFFPARPCPEPGRDAIPWASTLGLAFALVILAILAGRYLLVNAYLDHIEGAVVAAGWEHLQGAPLYRLEGGLPAFAVYYGPLAYLAPLASALLGGGSVWGSKLGPFLALSGTAALMAWHFVRGRQAAMAVRGLFYLAGGLLMMYPVCLWVRPDPFEVFLVAAAVVAANFRFGPAVAGLCLGLAVNFKVHAFVYFLPILADLWGRRGWRALSAACAVSLAVFAIPFLLPGISLADYVSALSAQAGRSLNTEKLSATVICTCIFAAPLALAFVRPGLREETQPIDRSYAAAALLTLAFLFYPANFPGAGPYHFLPLLPVLADALVRLGRRSPAIGAAPYFMLAFFGVEQLLGLPSIPGAPVLGQGLEARAQLAAEAVSLASGTQGEAVQVGYGGSEQSYRDSQTSRAALTLAGHPARFDGQVLMELRQIGVDGSLRLVPALASCEVRLWLLPEGEKPFSIPSYYDGGMVFGEEFRRAFRENYRLERRAGSYDLWACSHPPTQ